MKSHRKITVSVLMTGAALIFAGCAELQQLADSALPPNERAQRRLQSKDRQVRITALNDIADSKDALINVILGQDLCGSPNNIHYAVKYPDDVRVGAVDILFEKGKILALIGLVDDYRVGGGRIAMVKGDNSITSHIKDRIRTVDGLEKLCNECAGLQWKNDWTKEKWYLMGTDDPCLLSNECLLWALRHIYDKTMKNIFDSKTGSATTAGENVVKKMTDYSCLKTVAMDATCLMHIRIVAAEKMFKHSSVNGNDILAVIASFENADEEQMIQIAKLGLDAAKRIGAQNVVDALE